MPLFYRNFNTKDDIVKQYVLNIFNEYKWNDKWIEESAASWAMNVSTPATNEATLLTASR